MSCTINVDTSKLNEGIKAEDAIAIVNSNNYKKWVKNNYDSDEYNNPIYINAYFEERQICNNQNKKDRIIISDNPFENREQQIHAIKVISDTILTAESYIRNLGKNVKIEDIKKILIKGFENAKNKRINALKTAPNINGEIVEFNNYDDDTQVKFLNTCITQLNTSNALLSEALKSKSIIDFSTEFNLLGRKNELEGNTPISDDNVSDEDNDFEDRDHFDKAFDSSNATFQQTMNKAVMRVLRGLKRLNNVEKVNGEYNYYKSPISGLTVCIDPTEYLSILHDKNKMDCTDKTTFINSLREIAKSFDQYATLDMLADILENNESLLNLFINSFNNQIINKNVVQVGAEDSDTKVAQSNINANPKLSLFSSFTSTFRNTSMLDIDGVINNLSELFEALDNFKRGNITKYLSSIYTEANNNSIENEIDYVYNILSARVNDILRYINAPVDVDSLSLSDNKNADSKYKSGILAAEINKMISILKSINNNKITNEKEETRVNQINNKARAEAYKTDSEFKYTKVDYIPVIDNNILYAINNFTNGIYKYVDVKTELNSRNIDGSLVSNTISANYLTQFFESIKNELSIEQYFKIHKNLNQFAKSTAIFEIRDSNRNLIKPGLFDKNGNLTQEAVDCYSLELFDGQINKILGNKSGYKNMTANDYALTAYTEFLNTKDNEFEKKHLNDFEYDNNKFISARYFTPIPSDSPRQFIIKSYKIDCKNLVPKSNFIKGVKFGGGIFTEVDTDNISTMEDILANEADKIIYLRINDGIRTHNGENYGIKSNIAKYKNKIITIEINATTANPEYTSQQYVASIKNILEANKGKQIYIALDDDVKDENSLQPSVNAKKDDPNNKLGVNYRQRINGIADAITKDDWFKNTHGETTISFLGKELLNVTTNEDNNVVKVESPKAYIPLNRLLIKAFNKSGFTSEIKVLKNFRDEHSFGKYKIDKRFEKTMLSQYALANDEHVNSIKTANNSINSNHPIFQIYRNMIEQELLDAVQAADMILEYDENGNVIGIKEEFKNDTKHLAENYHFTRTILKDGKLTGRVFKLDTLQIRNSEGTLEALNDDDSIFNFLYGRDNTNGEAVRFTRVNENSQTPKYKLQLSENQNEAINKHIEKYISNAITESLEQERVLTLLKPDVNAFELFNMRLNYVIAMKNFCEIMYGNHKFTKDGDDFFKRAKEVQGSGLTHGTKLITDVNDFDKTIATINIKNDKGEIIKTIDVQNGFKYITANDVNKPIHSANIIKEALDKTNAPQEIKDLLYKPFGEKNTTINDGGSYITLDEFVRRAHQRGDYAKYEKLISALYDETKDLTPQQWLDFNQFIQVQKNFYFNTDYRNNLGMIVPNQIKNSETVLIPRFIKNTEFELINETMLKNGIGQLNIVSAEKVFHTKPITIWNNEGIMTEENYNTFDNQISNNASLINTASYRYLYQQQDTTQHLEAQNKVPIQLFKKIVDNITMYPEGKALAEHLMDMYAANVKESFDKLIQELGIRKDNNGNILINDVDGTIEVNATKFYKLVSDEIIRVGGSQNMKAYANISIGNEPDMPNWFPVVKTKIQSIFQSVFTNNITRQKLRGVHGPQISNVGFVKRSFLINEHADSKFRELSFFKSDKLSDGRDCYVCEVMLPAWAKDFYGANVTVEDLEKAGLDKFIGYRMPTEGKQSVSIMKVVGFLEPSQGSTIMVPDGWVAATGSDFDIDTIYTIMHNFYVKDSIINGVNKKTIHKTKYDNSTDEKNVYERYVKYITSNVDREYRKLIKKAKVLSTDERDDVMKVAIDVTKQAIASMTKKERNEEYAKQFKKNVKDIMEAANMQLRDRTLDVIDNIINDVLDDLGLIDFDTFKQSPVEEQNTRSARDNEFLDTMINILSMKESIEEQLSRSNFEDIIKARDSSYARPTYDVYNIFDQIKVRDNVRSGAALKAISIKLDTFSSICNYTKAKTDGTCFIASYPASKFEQLKAAFGNENVTIENGNAIVKHNMIGWSLNNRNSENKFITTYTSQTSAHQVDAVKEGGINNVTTYTFDVYKVFPNMGCNYDIAIRFMQQPSISKLVEKWSNNNSSYINSNFDPFNSTLRELLITYKRKLNENNPNYDGRQDYRLKTKDILKSIKEIDSTFDVDKLLVLNSEELKTHMNDNISVDIKSMNKEQLKYQIKVLYAYKNIKSYANNMSTYSTLLTTDKQGAKRSMFEINKFIDSVNYNREYKEFGEIITNTDKNIISSIFPSSDFEHMDLNESSYKYLYAQYKYSSVASQLINKNMYVTESNGFLALKEALGMLSKNLDEKTTSDFENYVAQNAMMATDFMRSNRFRKTGKDKNGSNVIKTVEDDTASIPELNNRRLYGFGHEAVDPLDFKNINIKNPTDKDILRFLKLSPANKVFIIKSLYANGNKDNLFNHLNVFLADFNSKDGRKKLTRLQYIENGLNEDIVLDMFMDAYNNENPFIRMTAEDLIRYAVAVDGMLFKNRGISKIINNIPMYSSSIDGGTNFIQDSNSILNNIIDNIDPISVIDKFYRSHPNARGIKSFKSTGSRTKLITDNSGKLVHNTKPLITYDGILGNIGIGTIDFDAAEQLGLIKEDEQKEDVFKLTSAYIRTESKDDKTKAQLFKIYDNGMSISRDSNDVLYIYPLNLLKENEISEQSIESKNNKYLSSDIYRAILGSNDPNSLLGLNNVNTLKAIDESRYRANKSVINYNDLYSFERALRNLNSSDSIIHLDSSSISSVINNKNGMYLVIPENDDIAEAYINDNEKGLKPLLIALANNKITNYTILIKNGSKFKNIINSIKNGINKDINTAPFMEKYNTIKDTILNPDNITVNDSIYKQMDSIISKQTSALPYIVLKTDSASKIEYKTGNKLSTAFKFTENIDIAIYSKNDNFYLLYDLNNSNNIYKTISREYHQIASYDLNNNTKKLYEDKFKELLNSRNNKHDHIIKVIELTKTDENGFPIIDDNDISYSGYIAGDEAVNAFINDNIGVITSLDTYRNQDKLLIKGKTEALRGFRNDNLLSNNSEELIKDDIRLRALKHTENFLKTYKDYINHKLNTFNINGVDYKFNSPEVLNAIQTDENLMQQFLSVVLDISSFVDNYKNISTIAASYNNYTTTDPVEANLINQIQDVLKNIENTYNGISALRGLADDARTKFFTDYVENKSTDPMVRAKLKGALEEWSDASFGQLWFQDIHETHISLLQTILKDVEKKIYMSNQTALKAIDKFNDDLQAILNSPEAKAIGLKLSDIIDDNGQLKQEFNEKYVNKLSDLRHDETMAKILADSKYADYLEVYKANKDFMHDYENRTTIINFDEDSNEFISGEDIENYKNAVYDSSTGETNIQHYGAIKKSLRPLMDKFKDAYYKQVKAELARKQFEHDTKILQINKNVEIDVLDLDSNGRPSKNQDGTNRTKKQSIDYLQKSIDFENMLSDKVGIDNYKNFKAALENRNRLLRDSNYDYSIEDGNKALLGYTTIFPTLEDGIPDFLQPNITKEQSDRNAEHNRLAKYYRQYLDNIKNLNKIAKDKVVSPVFMEMLKEKRNIVLNGDITGNTTSTAYIEANQWLKENTIKGLSPQLSVKLSEAFAILRNSINPKNDYVRYLLADAKDENGVVDGNKLSDAVRAKLKDYSAKLYNIKSNDTLRLIRNKLNDTIYTTEFYSKITGASDSSKNTDLKEKAITEINNILSKYYNFKDKKIDLVNASNSELITLSDAYRDLTNSRIGTIEDLITKLNSFGNTSIDEEKIDSDTEGDRFDSVAVFIRDHCKIVSRDDIFNKDIDSVKRTSNEENANRFRNEFTQTKHGFSPYKLLGGISKFMNKSGKSIFRGTSFMEFYRKNVNYISNDSRSKLRKLAEDTKHRSDLNLLSYSSKTYYSLEEALQGKTVSEKLAFIESELKGKDTTTKKENGTIVRIKIDNSKTGIKIINTGDFNDIYKSYLNADGSINIDAIKNEISNGGSPSILNDITIADNGEVVATPDNRWIETKTDKQVPTEYLYSELIPKDSIYIDTAKTEAKKLVEHEVSFEPTDYYKATVHNFQDAIYSAKTDSEKQEAINKYNKWFDDNHIFNPYNKTYDPIACWTSMEPKNKQNYNYSPKRKWVTNQFKNEFINKDYNENNNNVDLSNSKYDEYRNKDYYNMMNNPAAKKLYNYVQDTLNNLVVDRRGKNFVGRGYMPAEQSNNSTKDVVKSMFGWYDLPDSYSDRVANFGEITDPIESLKLFNQTKKDTVKRSDFNDKPIEDYIKALDENHNKNKELRKANRIAHSAAINKNWNQVLNKFISDSYSYKNKLEISSLLRATRNQLMQMEYYKKDAKGKVFMDRVQSRLIGEQQAKTTKGTNSVNQLETYMKKVLYNEFEVNQGTITKVSKAARNFVSMKYMMLNVQGGVSNVMFGLASMEGEFAAGEFIDHTSYANGIAELTTNAFSIIKDNYSDKTDNLTAALLKKFNVVELDKIMELDSNSSLNDNIKKIYETLYITQSSGEFFMHNSTMLGFLHSHRIYQMNGKTKIGTLKQFIRDNREQVFENILNESGNEEIKKRYNEFKESIIKNLNSKYEYISYRKDMITQFLSKKENVKIAKKFNESVKESNAELTKTFNGFPKVKDQFEVKKGRAVLKQDALITEEDVANLRNKIIEINERIHGKYSKSAANKLQSYWWGSLLMQFHKHIANAFTRRYGYGWNKSYYNEFRENVDKGSYVSFTDFVFGKQMKSNNIWTIIRGRATDNSNNSVNALQALGTMMKELFQFTTHVGMYYNLLPEYDKANIKRTIIDAVNVLVGIGVATIGMVAIKQTSDKDDDDESTVADIFANSIYYWGDRLTSEVWVWNPIGLYAEGKKLYNTPAVIQSTLVEFMTALGAGIDYYVMGNENALEYQSGALYGKNKITHNLIKQIPILNQLYKASNLTRMNNYYKLQKNIFSIVKEPIQDWVNEDEYEDDND